MSKDRQRRAPDPTAALNKSLAVPIEMIAALFRWSTPSRTTVAQWLQSAADATLVGGLGLTLLALGGRHDAGAFVYMATVAIVTAAMVARSTLLSRPLWLSTGPLAVGLAALACVALQLVPLPRAVLQVLAPGHEALLPLWTAGSPLGPWATVSLAPSETLAGLALLVAHLLLFLVVAERVRAESDVAKVLAVVAAAAVVLAVIGVLQVVFPSDRLLWVYDYPSRSFATAVQGTFSNRNHLAHFLIFGTAALAAGAFVETGGARSPARASRGKTRRIVCLFAAAFVVVVLLATQSRGGVAAFGVALLIAVLACWWRNLVGLKEMLLLAAMSTAVLLGVSFFDYDKVTSRLDDLVSGQIEELDPNAGRRLIWAANVRALSANPWLGHGAGSHSYVYPAYIEGVSSREFTHAESGYLQIACENGIAGLLVLAGAIGVVTRSLVVGLNRAATPRAVAIQAALIAGIVASLVHSVVDFVWYVPSLGMLMVVFAACAIRLEQLQSVVASAAAPAARRSGVPRPLNTSWIQGAVSVTAGACAVVVGWGPAAGSFAWDRYLRASKTVQSLESSLLTSLTDAGDPHLAGTIDETIRRGVGELQTVTHADPRNARAHARLAGRLLQQFENAVQSSENPMSVEMIADTVNSGGFQDDAAIRQWLLRAFGSDARLLPLALAHAKSAVRLCPLQGQSYLQVSRLSFLDPTPLALDDVVAQAVRVQPFDGRVRFDAGRQVHLAGDVETAFQHYRASMRMPGSHRQRLVLSLARVLPAAVFVAELDPDCAATDLVLAAYREGAHEEDLIAIAQHAEEATISESGTLTTRDSARRWRQVSVVNRSLKRYEKAIECATRAYELCPNDFWVRLDLAFAYYDSGAFAEADPHLRWCLSRRPDLRYLQQSLQLAAKQRLELGSAERMRTTTRFLISSRQSAAESDGTSPPETLAK